MSEEQKKAEELVKLGDAAWSRDKMTEASRHYSEVLRMDENNSEVYIKRARVYSRQDRYDHALADVDKALELVPNSIEGHVVKGHVLEGMMHYKDAAEVYRKGLELEPGHPDMKEGVKRAENKQREIDNPFCAVDMMERLEKDPKTKDFLNDPEFRRRLEELSKDPDKLIKYMEDERVVLALAVLLDVNVPADLSTAARDPMVRQPETVDDLEDLTGEEEELPEPPGEGEGRREGEGAKVEVTPEMKEQAVAEKEKGNAAYKQKDFATALQHYDKAIELDPTNITFLTNKAAVYFEQQEWDVCLSVCQEAVEKGREHRADFKIIAKALARMGNVYNRQEKWEEALRFYDKSLAEHRNPDIVLKKNETEKKMKEAQRRAYIDPEKSLEEKEKGNALFREGKFPEAVKCYTEAIKRNPDDPKLYSNRAACYQKLLEFPLALKDCEEAVRLDPTFVKAHIRKGHALLGMKNTVKAMHAFETALELDPNSVDAKNGLQNTFKQDDPEARRKAAMNDPEVQQILRDPAMQLILQQMQSNPAALREHLQNPAVAEKIQKLIECGFISLR